MVQGIAYYLILGKPLIMYVGILAYLSFVLTALIGWSHFKGFLIVPFRWHPRLAVLALVLISIHALFGLAAFFGF